MADDECWDYCETCQTVVRVNVTEESGGTAYTCVVCGRRVDFDRLDDVFDPDAPEND